MDGSTVLLRRCPENHIGVALSILRDLKMLIGKARAVSPGSPPPSEMPGGEDIILILSVH